MMELKRMTQKMYLKTLRFTFSGLDAALQENGRQTAENLKNIDTIGQNVETNGKPFKSYANNEIDGATERDVVERVEQLGKDVGIELAFLGEGPAKHWNRLISLSWGSK